MKITDVTAYPLMANIERMDQVLVSVPRPSSTGNVIFAGYRALLVRIDTGEGIFGVGEGLVRLAPKATQAIVEDLRPILVGRDPRMIEVIWDDLFATMLNRGHNRGFVLEAISAIDIALWDITAQSVGRPINALLGGARATEVPCYASSVRIKPPEEAARDAKELTRLGYNAIKLKIGRGQGRLQEDLDSVTAVRDAIGPQVTLMVDANSGYRLADAVRVARHLEHFGVAWFEEPLPPDDLDDYRALRAKVDIPIAAGEAWFTRFDFREAFVKEAVDIVQPDVSRCGGISEARKIAWMASAFHCDYAPHTGQSSMVCLTASLHLAGSMPNVLTYEFISSDWSPDTPNPLRTELGTPTLDSFREGALVSLPTGPGLGVDIDWEKVERYTVT